jgi:cysteine desulfurase/selenocysteine lyase
MNLRQFIVGADTRVPVANNKWTTAINFDNAATTPPFKSVLAAVNSFAPWYSSVHRGAGYKSRLSSELYEEARSITADFVGADLNYHSVIFVKNTTEAINKLAYILCGCMKDCVVLTTAMEHHSNDLPWRKKFRLDYINIDECGRLSLEDLAAKLEKYKGKVGLVAVTGASNVTGYMNPVHEIAEIAHKHGAKILVDGAQLVPHAGVSMGWRDRSGCIDCIDFLAFSAHKMYAPFGTGVLIGPKEIFCKGDPDYVGGGTVKAVTHKAVIWEDPPMKEEAGSPNIIGVAALAEAVKTLNRIGMKNIEGYEKRLAEYASYHMGKIKDVTLYCGGKDHASSRKVSIIPFNIEGMNHNAVAEILSQERGISVRSGCFCANPYVLKLLNKTIDADISFYADNPALRPGMVRVSFGLYNSYDEVDVLVRFLRRLTENRQYYLDRRIDG